MAYRDNRKELQQASEQMQHHSADLHPELAGKPAPAGTDGSISTESWNKPQPEGFNAQQK